MSSQPSTLPASGAPAAPPRAVTSALVVDVDRAAQVVVDFAADPQGHDLVVAVAPEQAALLAVRVEVEAGRRGVALDADIAVVPCEDRAGLAALLEQADHVIDSGCPWLAPAGRRETSSAPAREPLDVVLLNTYPSVPPQNGGGMRINALWGAMPADVGASAVVLSWGASEVCAPLTTLRPGQERQVPIWPALRDAGRAAGARAGVDAHDLGAGLALSAGDPFGRALAAAAERADAIVLSHPFLVRLAAAVAPGLPVVYDAHNVETDLKSDMYDNGPAGREAARAVAELEAEACARAALVVTCTDEDRLRLHELTGVALERVHVIPNGVVTADAPFTPWGARSLTAPRCVFAGSGHAPNVEAARIVLAAAVALPHVGFDLVGTVARALEGVALPGNVAVHGRVSEAEKQRLFRGAALALNPMRVGSGSNLKVADYAATGLPVLTSAVGARGFSGELVSCFAPCEPEPEALVEAIDAALADDWTDRTATARAIVEREHDWHALASRYADLLHTALRPSA